MATEHIDLGSVSSSQGSGRNGSELVALPYLTTNQTKAAAIVQRPLPTSLQSDFLPDEILLALTKRPMPGEDLAPPSRIRPQARASSVWNFSKRRDKLKHLTDSTACVCGAGKDISFLYDVPPPVKEEAKPNEQDPSSLRVQQLYEPKKAEKPEVRLPDTLIPDEFHLVKSRGVMGLEYHDEKFTTKTEDHEKHLVVFPSMNPASRFEVIQLQKTMDTMLEKAGVGKDLEISGITQIHRLLDLVKKEQDIYNVIFHELIRQSTVECVERGELLANLRNRYNCLLHRVPEEVLSLHNEVVAQRALDRRLTEELLRFKATIGILTSELAEVKEHDQRTSANALLTQDQIKEALEESKRNADLLNEYHTLYELQRHRLEQQVTQLNEEKELWSTTAYCLALKVAEESSLTTAKRLHVAEKSWNQLASHFTLLLADRDTETLTEVQGFVDKWRDMVDAFVLALHQQEVHTTKSLEFLKRKIINFKEDFKLKFMGQESFLNIEDTIEGNLEGRVVNAPDKEDTQWIFKIILDWEETVTQEVERFGGDAMLEMQNDLKKMKGLVSSWSDAAIKVFNRHRQENGSNYPEHNAMLEINKMIEGLMTQFTIRLTGDNGLARGLINFGIILDGWHGRLAASTSSSGKPLPDGEWAHLYGTLDEWVGIVGDATSCVGLPNKDNDKEIHTTSTCIEVPEILKSVQKWISGAISGVDSEDARLVQSVFQLHSSMVRWMVQMLLRLAPDHPGNSEEAHFAALIASSRPAELVQIAEGLFLSQRSFSSYVSQCCAQIVTDIATAKQEMHEDDPEMESNELKRLQSESEEWITTAKIMVEELSTGIVAMGPPPDKTISFSAESSKTSLTNTGWGDEARKDVDSPKPEDTVEPEESISKTAENDVLEKAEYSNAEDVEASTVERPISAQPAQQELESIGTDLNTHKRSLAQDPDQPQQDVVTLEDGVKAETPDTQTAFEALTAVKQLQGQLKDAEERAQTAEELSMTAELELSEHKERLQVADKKLDDALKEIEELKVTIANMETRPAMLKDDTGVVGKPILTKPAPKVEDEDLFGGALAPPSQVVKNVRVISAKKSQKGKK